jgi:hypothetical protein
MGKARTDVYERTHFLGIWFLPTGWKLTFRGWQDYGSFHWSVVWRLPPARAQKGRPCAEPLSGWIVQKITSKNYWWPNGDKAQATLRGPLGQLKSSDTYWEAWEVREGEIYSVYPKKSEVDGWGSPAEIKRMTDGTLVPYGGNTANHYAGEKRKEGEVVFVEGDGKGELPGFEYGKVSAALGLQSTRDKPTFWDGATSLSVVGRRKLVFQYDAQQEIRKYAEDTPAPLNMDPAHLGE